MEKAANSDSRALKFSPFCDFKKIMQNDALRAYLWHVQEVKDPVSGSEEQLSGLHRLAPCKWDNIKGPYR